MESEYKIGDYLLSKYLTDKWPYYRIFDIKVYNNLAFAFIESAIKKNKSIRCTSLLNLEKNYVKLNKSTIEILFGNQKEKENGKKE